MPVFGKKRNCPTSFELLALCCGTADSHRVGTISRHLKFCDFCAAEVELYLRFPPLEETVDAPPVPKHLFELAESILKRKKIDIGAGEVATA